LITRGEQSGAIGDPWASTVSPTLARRALNLTTLAVIAALLLKIGDPEFLLDALWITLAISAFILGLRATVIRLTAVLVLIFGSAAANLGLAQPVETELVDVTEWPLMIVVSTVVALMADRVSTMARRYAGLYRLASTRLTTAQEDERARLARDLHDGVGQTLTAVVLTLDHVEESLRHPDRTRAGSIATAAAVRHARELSVAALDETREVAAQLRPPRIHEIGLGAAIVDLAASAGIAVDVSFDPAILPPGLLDVQRKLDAYRIVQEAIGNAARHAGASVVTVDAALDGGELTLSVTDDGRGFVRDATPVGLGLAGMHERAAILLGKLDVRSVPGEGTTVELKIPIRSSEDAGARATSATQPAEVRA
jgi:signal transduction histidine kinase